MAHRKQGSAPPAAFAHLEIRGGTPAAEPPTPGGRWIFVLDVFFSAWFRKTAPVTILNLRDQAPFTTKDGSTIRSILDRANAPVRNQSLAEAQIPAGGATQRHYHKLAEEFYFILEGAGVMEIDGTTRPVSTGDAILIPPGAWHTITAREPLRFLCCCAPPYSHDDTYSE